MIEVSEEETQNKGKEQILKTIIQKTFTEIEKVLKLYTKATLHNLRTLSQNSQHQDILVK